LRRSRRNKVHPTEYWRGERPIYKRDSTGLAFVIESVSEGSLEAPVKRKISQKRKNVDVDNCRKRSKMNMMDMSIHVSGKEKLVKENELKKKAGQNEKYIKLEKDLKWKESKVVGADVLMAIIEKSADKKVAHGLLKIAPLKKKPPQETDNYTAHFVVICGAMRVKIASNQSVLVKNGDCFSAPPRTSYVIENLRKDEAYLHFTAVKHSS